MMTIKNLDQEINNLETKLAAVRKVRAEEEARIKKQEEKNKVQTKAAELINKGVEYIKEGFYYIMSKEDVEFLSETFLNESIIPLCCTLIKLGKSPLFKTLLSPNNIETTNIDIDEVIHDFLTAIGE